MEFVRHSYTYHLTRIDHRHNFSVYNTLLHIKSAVGSSPGLGVESLAFIPQLFLSVVAIPLLLAKKDLASTMLAQTFAFVTFNKVCTSQVCVLLRQISWFETADSWCNSTFCGIWSSCHSTSQPHHCFDSLN
jgi:hypothetical protein